MSTKLNLPKTLGSDFAKLSELAVKYDRTTTGNTSYTSPSSSVTYDTTGSAYDGTGEDGLFALLQTALEDYIVLAADFNNKIDTGALSDTDIAVDDSGFDTLTGTDQGDINADVDAILTANTIDYVRNPGYATTGGSPTAYTITLTPAPTAYATGMRFAIKLHVDCGATPTVNVNSLGAKTLLKNGDTAIIANEYKQNMVLDCIYDGTNLLIDAVDYAGETLTTQGDMLYRDGSGLQRLAKGTARQQLMMNSGETAPTWSASLQSLMTTQGDIVVASGANTPARLAVDAAANKALVSNGTTVVYGYPLVSYYISSDDVLLTDNTEQTSNGGSYITTHTFYLGKNAASFKVKVEIKSADANIAYYKVIDIDGNVLGSQTQTTSNTYVSYTFDCQGYRPFSDDGYRNAIYLQAKTVGTNAYVRNVTVCASETALTNSL